MHVLQYGFFQRVEFRVGLLHVNSRDCDREQNHAETHRHAERHNAVTDFLGEDSLEAARLSVAAALAGKFRAMHKPLYAAGRPTPEVVEATRKRLGLDAKALRAPDVDRELARNLNLQRQLDLSGTPAWVVGDKVLVGAIGYEGLKAAIAEARAKSGAN